VANAWVDGTGTLVVTPVARGTTTIAIDATDGVLRTSGSFRFTVTDVTKLRRFDISAPREHAITITNMADRDVPFELSHNGRLLATTADQLVQEAGSLADDTQSEPFEQKLWRYVRDETFHFGPLTESYWQHEPLVFLNSVGFGFCDDVTAVFATLARRAGYSARGWELWGHVVPEVQVGGRWAMYDPDLAVYYRDRDGQVASVSELMLDPSLITAPVAPVSGWSIPYSEAVADIYATMQDNGLIWDSFFVDVQEATPTRLPPQARLVYPGRWAKDPVTIYGTTPTVTSQLRLELPAGFGGTVDWPLVPWDVQGSGRVRIAGVEYAAGSPEVSAALQGVVSLPYESTLPRAVDVIEATGSLAIVYLVNPVRFSLRAETTVALRSVDAWALDVQLADESEESQVTSSDTAALQRPR
jgi:hypothetical protein